ncbi:uncharacterized protein LOC6649543 isoform X3 [Drosophila willistoni]|nr:uncharacterized protein LOC6649543 isoform X3 [Drosophila willistoni]
MASGMSGSPSDLARLNVRELIDVCAILKVEILMMGYLLERVLIVRDRLQRHQDVLCEFVNAVLIVESNDAQPKMRFSLSPPPQKAITASVTSTKSSTNIDISSSSSTITTAATTSTTKTTTTTFSTTTTNNKNNMLGHEGNSSNSAASISASADEDAASDYNQWLHAMKLVARLPGGTPPEFRRKLWLSLADKYLKSKNVDWTQQREKCFCEEWREDDEELGIQIVKDLHRTGSNLCTGPAGSINQAKLKRILLGYARYNPEVGYCQGFNMLGALILQVMDKEEEESMKVMIYLVEGVLPTGYFYGSMGGLQADMGVFRELMQTKLPRLAKHLQRLQGGPVENAYEPPLTNVFTMQWFLTMFCTCLPMSCVLRVWDLVLIEGSDVLLRTALVLWSLLEERVLNARTADEFYGKMGSFSSELLNGHLIDSNGLIEKVVKLGPIADLRHLRDKHLYNIAPLRHKQGIQLYYDDDDTHSDEERMAVATVWGLNWGRRGSVGPGAPAGRQPSEQKDRLALDISLLKKQYDRLRERQKQAHVILTTACSTATRQTPSAQSSVPVNQLLQGRHAIVTNRGKRVSAPLGAIPPARKPSLPAVLHGNGKPMMGEKQLRRGETLLWRDTDTSRRRRDSLTWKEIKADRAAMLREGVDSSSLKTQKLRTRLGKSDSSSYSEDSDGDQDEKADNGGAGGGSSTDTSLCDDDDPKSSEKSPKRKAKVARKLKEKSQHLGSRESSAERQRPKSWAPGTHEIPFMLMGMDSGDEKEAKKEEQDLEEDSATESGRFSYPKELDWTQAADKVASCELEPLDIDKILPNTAIYLSTISLSPPKTEDVGDQDVIEEQPIVKQFDVSDSGVTNQYFERVNSVERPNRLELSYSLNEEEDSTMLKDDRQSSDFELKIEPEPSTLNKVPQIRDDNIPGENKDDYKELLSMTIEEHKPPAATITSQLNASRKRRDPRRKTLTRSSTIEIEERFQALERTLSQDQPIHKYIPSTAALEERYNSLEKQLSAEKQRKEEDLDRIPSTADLESRFDALTKQMSSSESSNSKAPLDLNKDQQQPGEKSKETERKSNKNQSKEGEKQTQSEPKETASEKESPGQKEETKEIEEEQQPRLKKLPSTAELEDRFNALERKMSVQKSSSAKTKKEPPDEEKPAQKTEAQTKETKSKQESSPQKTPENIETSEKSTKISKDSNEVKDKADEVKRKVPPSTEELEKRFNALEKQLSTTNLEAEQPTTSKAKEIKSELPKQTENVKANKQEIQSQKSIKSFDEKVKVINTKLTADEQKIQDHDKLAEEKRKSLDEKSERASGQLKEMLPENETIKSKTSQPEVVRADVQPKELGKRRASEPPSTEDLEKRYETLKRRMSSKNHFGNLTESADESMSRRDQEVISETLETGEPERKQSPPTTEYLESRYEKLHGENKKTTPKKVDVAIEAHISPPPAPPPPPKPNILADPAMHKQRALIEELQAKIQEQGQSTPGEENLKPSEINPQRKQRQEQQRLLQRPTTMGDETSEAPAKTAYYRSGNYEPWQQQHQQKQRMVRRFSDLPSRADLENRLQFLEKQLYKKFYKQRCASDSEVASRTIDDEKPSTSAARVAEVQLEQRVLALEKQLSENSLKLLEAMRVNVPNVDGGSPRRLSTDTIDATGKELVRYTQNFGELDELGGDGSNKPINISINIKMMLNKEQQQQRQQQQQQQQQEEKADTRTSTEDLRMRLEQLEQQLMEERAKNNGFVDVESANDGGAGEEAKQLDKSETSVPEELEENKKQEKDSHNQTVKSDEAEMTEDPIVATTVETIEPETVKETKTLENEEIAQATQEKAAKAEEIEETTKDKINESSEVIPKVEETKPPTETETHCEEKTVDSDKIIVNASSIEPPVDPNNKTVVLLMDNEPRASRVRRLTRANTEELEGLFQALEKQLQDRNLIKSEDGRLIRASTEQKQTAEQVEQAQAISDLTKEIEDFTSGKPDAKSEGETKEDKPADGGEEPPDDYDWGPNPVKHHLKRKTVYLPSTKELEARFRSLERQIKLLEDVEKIDVEQRLNEIERKIKLQYSLSHEKDLNKYLELCEGKGLDEEEEPIVDASPPLTKDTQRSRSPARKEASKSPYTSPSRKAVAKSPHTSPARKPATKSPYTSPSRASDKKRSPYTSPVRRQAHPGDLPISDDLEYKYRVLDLVRSKSKENLSKRKTDPNKKPPIHPLEMLLDPSPDDSEIPTTGELEHRIRLLDEKLKSPCRHKSRSRSPTIDDMKRKKLLEEKRPKSPVHTLERLVSSPNRPEPPTEEELEQRMRALEDEKRFDFKTQKDYKAFNQKLKDVISPSLSFEEFKAAKSREQSPRRQGATTPKSAMRRDDTDDYRGREETPHYRPTSPKVIRFRDEDEDYYKESQRPKSRQSSERMTLADRSYSSSIAAATASSSEGLDALGSRLMRETSPITRTGTHTGVPLRTGENINDRLSSIKDTIKSIDTLCEEKPYQKEKCQRYIDSLFSDSLHFGCKKNSMEELTHSRSESRGRTAQRSSDYTPAIRVTSEHRSLGSADSKRTSPLRASSPLHHHRSHRDISRELSPRRRRDAEDMEERESSRVRRDNMLPNYFLDNRSDLSSGSSLTKFHKVDRQLEETCAKYEADDRRSASRTPLSSPYESRTTATRYNNNNNTGTGTTTTTTADTFQRPVSPYRQPYDPYRRNVNAPSPVPVYQPAKLEIRHTTVTSTFYDRFLTEKQIEKQTLSRPPSRSPVVSPSASIAKSDTDLPGTVSSASASASASQFASSYSSAAYKPTVTTAIMSSSYAGTATSHFTSSLPTSNYSYLMSTSTNATTTTTSSSSTTGGSSGGYVPYNFSSSFSNRHSDPIANSSGISSGSTGVYNPMMSFTLREPTSASGSLLGQYAYKSSFVSNYSSSSNQMPKSPSTSDQDKL